MKQNRSKVERVKELLGLNKDTDKADMSEHRKKIIEEVEREK